MHSFNLAIFFYHYFSICVVKHNDKQEIEPKKAVPKVRTAF
jgi:hypothetical protein